VVGLMNVLTQEGAKYNIKANILAPTAATRMTEGLLPQQVLELLKPETITPGLLTLLHEDAPSRMILGAGGGVFAETRIYETEGVAFGDDELDADAIAARMDEIRSEAGQQIMPGAFAQTRKYAQMAAKKRGIELPEK
ncbi:MAG: 3-oxoacyl-ACP reductase, partial [Pseudooceanicola nanhaiensis]